MTRLGLRSSLEVDLAVKEDLASSVCVLFATLCLTGRYPFSPFSPTLQKKPTVKKSGKKSLAKVKYTIDCWAPVEDKVMDPSEFEKYLKDRIKWGKIETRGAAKITNKAGNFGDKVVISRDKAKLTVTAEQPFSKRYLKYLTKKYLQKQQLRDYLHVVASSKGAYEMKYYKVSAASD